MTAQHFEFSNRLARIEAGQGSFKSTLFVGPDDTHRVTYRERGQRGSRKGPSRTLKAILMLPVALCVALLAGFGARLAIHMANLATPTPETIDVFLAVEFGGALVLSTVIGMLVGLRLQDHLGLRMLAILAGMFALHNVVHMYPQPFVQYVPGGWADMILASTEANTLIIRGATYSF
jgi:hypothetical protein